MAETEIPKELKEKFRSVWKWFGLFILVAFSVLFLLPWVSNEVENGLHGFIGGLVNFFLTNFRGICVEVGGIVARLAFVLMGLEGIAIVAALGVDVTGAIVLSGIPLMIIIWIMYGIIDGMLAKTTE